MGIEVAIRPIVHHLVSKRETLVRGKDRPRIAHGHPIAEKFCGTHERRGEVNSTEDDHARRRGKAFYKDTYFFLTRFAVRPIAPGRGEAGRQFALRVASDNPVKFRIAKRAERVKPRPEYKVTSDGDTVGSGDNCHKGNGLFGPNRIAQRLVERTVRAR